MVEDQRLRPAVGTGVGEVSCMLPVAQVGPHGIVRVSRFDVLRFRGIEHRRVFLKESSEMQHKR